MSQSQRLPSTSTAAASVSASFLQAATTQQRSNAARSCEASLRSGDPRRGDARPQPATRLVWWCQRRQQAAKLSAAAASALLFGTGPAHGCRLWRFGPFRRRKEVPGQKKVTKVMILMSDTGGGHRASAQALQAGFKELFGDRYAIDVVDLATQHSPYPFNQASKSYNTMVKYPVLWRLGYTFTQPRIVHVPMQHVMTLIMGRQISDAFEQYQPDLVVSVHPLMQAVPLRVLRQREARGLSDRISFATVVTDLSTCHNTWFHPGVDRCFVATPEAKERALQMGLQSEQVVVHGLPIRPAFTKRQPPRRKLRKQLGLRRDEPAVFLVGGGEGMGPVERTVESIAAGPGARVQLVVVCGRNAKLVKRLSEKTFPEGMHVIVKGFVNNMEQWMNACDMIITKAGPGTIAEAFICGLPVLLNAFIPCQEEGNVEYVVRNQTGIFSRDPQTIAATVEAWTGPECTEFEAMAKRAKALGKPDALFRIVRDLAKLSKHSTTVSERREAVPALAS